MELQGIYVLFQNDDIRLRPWYVIILQVDDNGQLLHSAMNNAESYITMRFGTVGLPNMDALLRSMRRRHSSNLIDKVCSLAFPFQRLGYDLPKVTFPIYDPGIPISVAWNQLISSIASLDVDFQDLYGGDLRQANHTPTVQLLCLFSHPSRHYWFPSWTQVQQYPDVSVRDNDDLGLFTKGLTYLTRMLRSTGMLRTSGHCRDDLLPTHFFYPVDSSLHIVSGRIYRGCSLQLTQPRTPEKQAIYFCTMDDKGAQLVATVPGIKLHIDPTRKYVLVDISPDTSVRCTSYSRVGEQTEVVHKHLPIWQKSMVLVCEEVGLTRGR